MALDLYLDDCANSRLLAALLRQAGHSVETPDDASLLGAEDAAHFAYAASQRRALVTKNPSDFVALHETGAEHSGLLLVYQDNDRARDMGPSEIVQAIARVEEAYGADGLRNQCLALNHFRY